MTWDIYGIRLIGDPEIRYVGQTGKGVERRLYEKAYFARRDWGDALMSQWMRDNEGRVEVVVIDTVTSEVDARAAERATVKMLSNIGHRLFNRNLIAREKRLVPWGESRSAYRAPAQTGAAA